MKLNVRERIIIGGTVLLLLGYFIYSLIIPPQLLNLKAVEKQLLAQSHFLQSKKQRVENLLILKGKYDELRERTEENIQRFFTHDEVDTFLEGLNNLVEKETHNSLISIQPLSEEIISESLLSETKMHYKRSDFQVVVTGKFSTICDLIHRFFTPLIPPAFLRKQEGGITGFTSDKLLSLKEVNIKIEKEEPLELRASFILSLYILSATEG